VLRHHAEVKRRFLNPDSVAPGRGYSHGVTVSGGHTTWTAGQVAFDDDGNVVGEGDVVAQTRRVFENLSAVLAEAGATWADVVKLNYFVTDLSRLQEIREVRNEFLDPDRLPASTLVQVSALAMPELLIEVEAVVVVE
jgi:enamine deaminase RidA (YjgF/YER057c/UK114 family)